MIINTIPATNCTPQTIVIGRRGTYDTMQIVFDLSYLIENYGSGTAVLAVKRSQDESAYPAIVTQEDATLLWTVNETDTAYVGSGECQLMWYVDGGLAKTIIYPMVVMRDILATSEEPPDGYENWVEHLTELGAETQQNAQNAAQSASDASTAKDDAVTAKEAAEAAQEAAETAVTHYPKIENNYWMMWDVASQSYVSTEIQAEGEDGYSPEISITTITGGHRVTITDKDHPQGQSFDVMDGQGGGGTSDYTVLTNKPQINGHTLTGNQTAADLGLGTYSKPSGGIPKTDLASDVQTSLGKADSALQTAPVQSVAGKTGAVTLGAGDVGFSSSEEYNEGTVGAKLSELTRQLSDETTGLDTKAPVIINTASGAIASFDDGADSMPVKKLVAQIEPVQSGTGDPSPDNVRPISGWTGAEIEQTGVNVWDEQWESGGYNRDGKIDMSGAIRCKDNISVASNTSYYFKLPSVGEIELHYLDANGDFISGVGLSQSSNPIITTPVNCKYIRFYATTNPTYNNDISINYPSTDTTYEPYTGNQISVDWETEAGAVYGGAATINSDSSGKLSSQWVGTTFGQLSFIRVARNNSNTGYIFYAALPQRSYGKDAISDTFNNVKLNDNYAWENIKNGEFFLYQQIQLVICADCSTVEELLSVFGNVQLVYKVSSYIDYSIQPDHISGILTTLYGTNNIWADTGDVEVTYPCDTRLYIDNKITQAIANALNS